MLLIRRNEARHHTTGVFAVRLFIRSCCISPFLLRRNVIRPVSLAGSQHVVISSFDIRRVSVQPEWRRSLFICRGRHQASSFSGNVSVHLPSAQFSGALVKANGASDGKVTVCFLYALHPLGQQMMKLPLNFNTIHAKPSRSPAGMSSDTSGIRHVGLCFGPCADS